MRWRGPGARVVPSLALLLLAACGEALGLYLAHDVPVALATDVEGVLRTDLTGEYVRAVLEQGLDCPTLKRLTRNSLEYSFLPGASPWAERGRYRSFAAACAGERRP